MSLLPHVGRANRTAAGRRAHESPAAARSTAAWYLEPITAISPHAWPPAWGAAARAGRLWRSGWAATWLWCFALTPRIWRGRRGAGVRLRLIAARVGRELRRPPLRGSLVLGHCGDCRSPGCWAATPLGPACSRRSSASSASGGLVWAVRLIGTSALAARGDGLWRRDADDDDRHVSRLAGVSHSVLPVAVCRDCWSASVQFVLRRDDVIPFGPFLCLAAAAVVVGWAPIWIWAQPMFGTGLARPGGAGRLPGPAGCDARRSGESSKRPSSVAQAIAASSFWTMMLAQRIDYRLCRRPRADSHAAVRRD